MLVKSKDKSRTSQATNFVNTRISFLFEPKSTERKQPKQYKDNRQFYS